MLAAWHGHSLVRSLFRPMRRESFSIRCDSPERSKCALCRARKFSGVTRGGDGYPDRARFEGDARQRLEMDRQGLQMEVEAGIKDTRISSGLSGTGPGRQGDGPANSRRAAAATSLRSGTTWSVAIPISKQSMRKVLLVYREVALENDAAATDLHMAMKRVFGGEPGRQDIRNPGSTRERESQLPRRSQADSRVRPQGSARLPMPQQLS